MHGEYKLSDEQSPLASSTVRRCLVSCFVQMRHLITFSLRSLAGRRIVGVLRTRRKGLGAAVLLDHAEGSSIPQARQREFLLNVLFFPSTVAIVSTQRYQSLKTCGYISFIHPWEKP